MASQLRTTFPTAPLRARTKLSRASLLLAVALAATGGLKASGYPLQSETLPASLQSMIDTERAFAARAKVVGWKQSFLEYFADSAIGFDGGDAGSAKDQVRKLPDPPKDMQLLWEPRHGDVAASGELGYLTGPSTNINPARNN